MKEAKRKSLEDYPVTLTVQEVAELLRINRTAAYQVAKQEGFPSIRIGNRIIVPKEGFKNWLNRAAG